MPPDLATAIGPFPGAFWPAGTARLYAISAWYARNDLWITSEHNPAKTLSYRLGPEGWKPSCLARFTLVDDA